MRSFVLLAALALSFAATSQSAAQNRRGGQNMMERQKEANEAIIKKLALTQEQQAPVEAIFAASLEKRQALMDSVRTAGSGRGGFAQMRERFAELDNDVEAQLMGVLTDKQMDVYKEEMKARAESAANRRRGGRGGGASVQ